MMKNLVSFIIPLYNGKEYLANTISVIEKVNNNKEIIVVDDGSTDGSDEYCDEIKKKYSNVKIIRTENGGIFSARNVGIKNANGEYIVFIDQDDYIDATQMDNCIDLIRTKDLDAVLWSCMYDCNGTTSYCDEVREDCIVERKEIEDELIPALLFRESSQYTSFLGHVWAGIYSAELIKNNNIKFKRIVDYEDDQLFVYDILLHSKAIGFKKEAAYFWVTNPESYSHGRRRIDDIQERYERYFSHLIELYRTNVNKPNDSVIEELSVFGFQFTFCETIRNFGISLKKDDYSQIKNIERRKEYRDAIRSKSKHIREKRFKIYLLLSKLGLTRISLLCTSLYFRRRGRKQG